MKKRAFSHKNTKPQKTVGIVRYGAIGDMIQMSSILPWLKAQGYHVTLYCQSGNGYDAIKHDPHIDRFIIQDKDMIPPQFLEEFWNDAKKKYTKWINLSESVEATLLASPGRAQWDWPNEVRAKYLDRNYLEWTHELAGVPPPYQTRFYATPEEKSWAQKTAKAAGSKNVIWSLSGSSGHKVWPHLDAVVARIMLYYKDMHVFLCGDEFCRILETGWEKEPRVHCVSGKWSIRESLAFTEVADLIIGTETGLLNSAGMMSTPKIITLSHSSEEMLTKHWKNTVVLKQPKGIGCSKYPCRQLHGGFGKDPWLDCPQEHTTGTALCQYHVDEDMMWHAVLAAMQFERMAA